MNAKRLFVHKSRVDEVVKGLSARLEKVKLGYGLDQGTTMGPLHSPAQKAFVDSLIKEAKESGAKVLEFGELPGGDLKGGNFVRPAIVVDPKITLRVVTEEQFGPVIPVIPSRPKKTRSGWPTTRGPDSPVPCGRRTRRRPIAWAARWSAATCG